MMLTTLSTLAALALHGPALVCPVMGGETTEKSPFTDLGGVRYRYCCPMCKATFEKDPAKAIAAAQKRGKAFGSSLFDPVSGDRLDHAKSIHAYSEYKGVRFLFHSDADKTAFDKAPAPYADVPSKEALYCPVSKEKVASYEKASGYADYQGVRYYFCCDGCDKPFKADPAKYTPIAAPYVRSVAVSAAVTTAPTKPAAKDPYATTAKVGKYQIELRVPEGGLFAGETVDVEFRLSDTTQNDAIEGKKGVPEAKPTAAVTMPAMQGMPIQRPHIHGEGVPGDYGVELFFPHGGDYKIGLRMTPPGDKPIYAEFLVPVKDAEARKGAAVAKPYAVELLDLPPTPKAGRPMRLHLAIKDTKTGETVKSFDVAHTKLFHLMLVSKDLGWFVHEHPVPQPDGTFTIDWTFPAGGDYLVFADVAPKDKGSQVVSTPLRLEGPAATWSPKLVPSKGPSRDGSIVASFVPTESPIPIGKTTVLSFKLRDAASGKPVTDLQPYLGAQGHLMIVHQDGGTFVHSHPAEDAASMALSKKGDVRFTARFPRAGLYKAWAQFQRGGKVSTVSYVFEVK